jgi:myo-inositol-1(or 4)-monophosphatase
MDLEQIRRIGIGAAYEGGEILTGYFGNISDIQKKGAIDLVTEADYAAEKAIIETIRSRFPDHAVLAEESGLNAGTAEFQWIIDPLDGTTNYTHRLGLFCVSIAFALQGSVAVGIVLNPITGELFTAVRNAGAELNGRAIRVSDTDQLSESLLVTGFPYNFKKKFNPLMARFTRCLEASQGIRRLGSAALDLCFVACGRFDGFWEEDLHPWDTAAGMLIAMEAGARVTDFSNAPYEIQKSTILATNGRIHEEMIPLLSIKEE